MTRRIGAIVASLSSGCRTYAPLCIRLAGAPGQAFGYGVAGDLRRRLTARAVERYGVWGVKREHVGVSAAPQGQSTFRRIGSEAPKVENQTQVTRSSPPFRHPEGVRRVFKPLAVQRSEPRRAEPRYRGPESGADIPVSFAPLWFAPVLSVTTSLRFGPSRCAAVQIVSMCLTRLGSQPVSLSGHGFKPAMGLAFQSC
jgi:hypothetical protein